MMDLLALLFLCAALSCRMSSSKQEGLSSSSGHQVALSPCYIGVCLPRKKEALLQVHNVSSSFTVVLQIHSPFFPHCLTLSSSPCSVLVSGPCSCMCCRCHQQSSEMCKQTALSLTWTSQQRRGLNSTESLIVSSVDYSPLLSVSFPRMHVQSPCTVLKTVQSSHHRRREWQ